MAAGSHISLPGPLVDAEWLAEHLDEVAVFDSRKYGDGRSGREQFELGHIPGAVFVDLDADLAAPPATPGTPGGRHPFPTPEHFAQAMSRLGFNGNQPAVIYDDVGGGMAARLWFMFDLIGVPAAVLDVGIGAWDGPLATGPVSIVAGEFAARPWPTDRLVSADQVAARLDDGGLVIDARSSSRYEGKQNRIDDRYGHIPGAISRAWEDNIDDFTGAMLTAEQLAARFELVIDASDAASSGDAARPVAYCGSGVTACHNLLALRLLDADADLYVCSWSEWGSDESRPLETGSSPY